MKNGMHQNRKEQIESFARMIRRSCPEISKSSMKKIREKLRGTALVASCEERSWCLSTINACKFLTIQQQREIEKQICSRGVLEVLGYKECIERRGR